MQLKKLLIGFLFMGAMACNKTVTTIPETPVAPVVDNTTVTKITNTDINTWIHENMTAYYLWPDKMPALAKTNTSSNPMDYFYSILYEYKTTDRFSWIDSSSANLINQLNGINTVLGIRVSAFYTDDAKVNVALVIAYVLKGSPAEKNGLKRGDIILSVDDKTVTSSNYSSVLQNQTLKLGLGAYDNKVFSSTGKTITVTKVELQTNPILQDTVINWAGKKVGYFAYLQFLSSFDDSLRAVFGRFKQKGVNELVIDLRYNGGGYVSSSDLLTNLMVKDLASKVDKVMNKRQYNDAYTKEVIKQYGASALVTNFKMESNNIGSLNRVFFLTSTGTASASELIINNLKPFMNVILIGEHTYGKNVGSFTITDNAKRWNYGLQPITFKILNALDQSDYGSVNGFLPDYALTDDVLPYKLLGDPNETYLNKALNIIGPVAYKASAIGSARPVSRANKLQAASISDNPIQDKLDMFDKPLKPKN
ncbi:MAG: PDZ domain-containing protein [Chitinophagaceae bacterium]|nr:PDZ domain-containing protein [Chitinophagaceae bacterium]